MKTGSGSPAKTSRMPIRLRSSSSAGWPVKQPTNWKLSIASPSQASSSNLGNQYLYPEIDGSFRMGNKRPRSTLTS